MSIKTVQVVFTDQARWAVETDNLHETRVTYASRGAAIAAGVHIAMAEEAVLMIHGVDSELSDLDFRDCDVLGPVLSPA